MVYYIETKLMNEPRSLPEMIAARLERDPVDPTALKLFTKLDTPKRLLVLAHMALSISTPVTA